MLSMKHVFFLGCGANIGTAREGALKLSEMLHVQTNDFEIEEFLHGPDLQLTPEYTLFLFREEIERESARKRFTKLQER